LTVWHSDIITSWPEVSYHLLSLVVIAVYIYRRCAPKKKKQHQLAAHSRRLQTTKLFETMRSLSCLRPKARSQVRTTKLKHTILLVGLLSASLVSFSHFFTYDKGQELERRRLSGCPTKSWDNDDNENQFKKKKKTLSSENKAWYKKKHYKDSPAGGGYPADLFLDKDYRCSKNKWAIIFHFIGSFYMLLGLSVICDEYFVGALEAMVERFEVKPDVAGATFMAAGGSAPELFTSIMGVFVSQNDVGFGTIVGSAVFNVLFVIGLCALFAGSAMTLTWWPLFRDCTYYICGLIILAFCVEDERVTWWEAAILFLLYIGYIVIMYFNQKLDAAAYAY
jgi:Ca2+/H+ antiporter